MFSMDAVRRVYDFYAETKLEKRAIGASALGAPIVAFHAGSHSRPQLLVQCAMHAREWVTALLGLEFLRQGMPRGGMWVIPLVNPDGARIALRGERFVRTLPPLRARFLRGAGGFPLWKGNADGVDLNVNFDARWGKGRRNVFSPAAENYVGPMPCSARETRALCAFTRALMPDATVSYHTKGEEIYWEFCGRGDSALAETLSAETGYPLARAEGSCGGYKDWCLTALNIPSFTVEAGSDALEHPLTEAALPSLWAANAGVPAALIKELICRKAR